MIKTIVHTKPTLIFFVIISPLTTTVVYIYCYDNNTGNGASIRFMFYNIRLAQKFAFLIVENVFLNENKSFL